MDSASGVEATDSVAGATSSGSSAAERSEGLNSARCQSVLAARGSSLGNRPPATCEDAGTSSGCVVGASRSEEHTSELQSLMRISYAVFCLKKKKKNTMNHEILTQHQ